MTTIQILSVFQLFGWVFCLIMISALPSIGHESSPIMRTAHDPSSACPTQSPTSSSRSRWKTCHHPSPSPLSPQPQQIYGGEGSEPPNPIATDHAPQHATLDNDYHQSFPPPPPPPEQVPQRFLDASNGDYAEAQRRYYNTLEWRQAEQIDTILREPFPHFYTIKQHYPHYFHGFGFRGQPVYYEFPAKADMKALKRAGLSFDQLIRYYNMITEFQWQMLSRDDTMTSIFIADLDGITLADFVGEAVELVKKASKVSAEHYPERAGLVFIINVPKWFKLIWKAIVPLVPETTLKKIFVLRGREEVLTTLAQHVPMENIPAEYGGASPMPLGQSAEEKLLADLVQYNLYMATAANSGVASTWNHCFQSDPKQMEQLSCRFGNWAPARSY